MQKIGSKCLVVFEAVVVEIVGAVEAPFLIVQDDKGARFKVGSDCVLDGSVVLSVNQFGDTVDAGADAADQYTGADMGAEMAAAEVVEPFAPDPESDFQEWRKLFGVADSVDSRLYWADLGPDANYYGNVAREKFPAAGVWL